MQTARFFILEVANVRTPPLLASQLEDGKVRCEVLRAQMCDQPGKRILQGARKPRGKLFSLSLRTPGSRPVDPIEKKTLYHFLPGSLSYSIAAPGCNFRCKWCQNGISRRLRRLMSLVDYLYTSRACGEAQSQLAAKCCFSYTEPTISLEYNLDVSRLAHDAGLKTIYITNGYMTPEMLELTIRRWTLLC